MEDQFYEFAVILAIAATAGAIGRLLRQPLIVTFIAVGILVGPAWLGIVAAGDDIDLLARMGIAILLFLVGFPFSERDGLSAPFRENRRAAH